MHLRPHSRTVLPQAPRSDWSVLLHQLLLGLREGPFQQVLLLVPHTLLPASPLPRHLCTYNEAGDSWGPWQAQFSLRMERDQGG